MKRRHKRKIKYIIKRFKKKSAKFFHKFSVKKSKNK